jgi:hypothetical protein
MLPVDTKTIKDKRPTKAPMNQLYRSGPTITSSVVPVPPVAVVAGAAPVWVVEETPEGLAAVPAVVDPAGVVPDPDVVVPAVVDPAVVDPAVVAPDPDVVVPEPPEFVVVPA